MNDNLIGLKMLFLESLLAFYLLAGWEVGFFFPTSTTCDLVSGPVGNKSPIPRSHYHHHAICLNKPQTTIMYLYITRYKVSTLMSSNHQNTSLRAAGE